MVQGQQSFNVAGDTCSAVHCQMPKQYVYMKDENLDHSSITGCCCIVMFDAASASAHISQTWQQASKEASCVHVEGYVEEPSRDSRVAFAGVQLAHEVLHRPKKCSTCWHAFCRGRSHLIRMQPDPITTGPQPFVLPMTCPTIKAAIQQETSPGLTHKTPQNALMATDQLTPGSSPDTTRPGTGLVCQ